MTKAALLLILTVILTGAPARADQPSLQSRESIKAAVDQYVLAFMTEQVAAPSSPNLASILDGGAQDGDRTALDQLSKLLDASLDKHETHDWSNEALQRELGKLTNGGRASDRLLAKLGVTTDRVAGAGTAIHSELVSWLVARYYDRPEERDALYSLLAKFSDELQPQLRARGRDVDNLIHYLSQGTSIGMTAVMIYDFRRHIMDFGKAVTNPETWQDLRAWTTGGGPRRAAQGAVEWSKATADSLRGGVMLSNGTSVLGLELGAESRLAEQLAQERQLVSGSPTALLRLEKDTEGNLRWLGRNRIFDFTEAQEAERAALREAPAARSRHQRAAQYLGKLASQVARGFLVGGIPAGAYALNEQSEAGKVDPLEVLKAFQFFAVAEVEMDGEKIAAAARQLAAELRQPGLTEAKRKATRAMLKDLAAGYELNEKSGEGVRTRHVAGLTDLRSRYEHLQAHATRFKGVTQYPNTLAEIAAYRKKFAPLKLLHRQDERVTAFLSASKELEDRISSFDEKFRAEAATHGFATGAQLAASLAAADLQLQAAEEALRALDDLAKPAK